ncbi:hypothetical protein D3C73_1455650 [compost metagenome]
MLLDMSLDLRELGIISAFDFTCQQFRDTVDRLLQLKPKPFEGRCFMKHLQQRLGGSVLHTRFNTVTGELLLQLHNHIVDAGHGFPPTALSLLLYRFQQPLQ